MRAFLVLFILVVFCSCSNDTEIKASAEEMQKSDSIADKLNSPELKNINNLLRNNPSQAELYFQRAVIYRKLTLWKEAENDIKRAIKIDSNKVEYHMELADIYFASNQTRKSKEALEKIIKKFPQHTQAYLKLGELYYFVRKYKEASDMVNKAIRLEPDNADAYFLRGNIFREAGDTSKSISSFQTAIELNPTNDDAWYDLGLMYYHKKNSLALQYFQKALQLKKSVRNLFAYGSALQRFGKYEDAIRVYDTILKIQPDELAAKFNKGAIMVDVYYKFGEAMDIFKEILQKDSTNIPARLALAWCLENTGKRKSAVEEYKKVLKFQANNPKAVDALNRLE